MPGFRRFDIDGAHRHEPYGLGFMLNPGRYPHGTLGRNYPGALARSHDHYPRRGENELAASVGMPACGVVPRYVAGQDCDRPRDVLIIVRIRTARGGVAHAWRF